MKRGQIKKILMLGGMFCFCFFSPVLFCSCGRNAQKKSVSPKAKLELVSEPESAQIFVNGAALGVTPKRFSVKPGTYLLRFVKDGCEPQFMHLEIRDSTPKKITVRLKRAVSSALLLSRPDRAQVVLDGRGMGETPYVLTELAPGKHSVQFRKGGYAPRSVSFETAAGRPAKVSVQLQSNIGKLVIRSNPPKARVFINGKSVGTTPYQGSWSEGTLDYRIQLGGYGEISGKETIVRGKTASVDKTLQLLPAALKVESTPAGATVFIGRKNYGKTPLTISDLVPNREYTVVLQLGGCGEERRKVFIPPGRTASIKAALSSDKGGIDLLSGPAGLTVYCDGRKVGVLKTAAGDDKTVAVLEIRGLLPGKHKISIAHKRGIPSKIEKEVTVIKKKIIRVDAGKIWVPNAVIHYQDGQSSIGYIHGEDKEKGYWFEDAKFHSPYGGSVKGYVPYDKVREVKHLPLTE